MRILDAVKSVTPDNLNLPTMFKVDTGSIELIY